MVAAPPSLPGSNLVLVVRREHEATGSSVVVVQYCKDPRQAVFLGHHASELLSL
jgi:hypothetical protein